jgi:hypothetical protein
MGWRFGVSLCFPACLTPEYTERFSRDLVGVDWR